MVTKHRHYNPTDRTSSFVAKIEQFFKDLNIDELKVSKKKSDYVREMAKSFLIENGIVGEVNSEVSFIYGKKDCIDVEMLVNGMRIIVEIDNLRADQVVKKVLSRTSAFPDDSLIYITFCYDSNSAKGHKDECLKYIEVHFKNYFRINSRIEYLAFVPTKHIK